MAAGVYPSQSADDLKRMRIARSGVVRAQREVDKETREKGVAAGEKLARSLGVPTTAERTTIHPDTGEKKIQVWGPDRVFKHVDTDRHDVEGDSEEDLANAPAFLRGIAAQAGPSRSVSLKGANSPGTSDADRRAQSHQRAKDASANRIDPDRLEKIKRGILNRNAAPTKLGPDRPPSFDGEVWKPHGRERDTLVSRPDQATGNWIRGKMTMNPKNTGGELVGLDGKWVAPSVYASNMAQRKAKGDMGTGHREFSRSGGPEIRQGGAAAADSELMRKLATSPRLQQQVRALARSKGVDLDQLLGGQDDDFSDDGEKTDPDATPFKGDD